MDGYIGEVKVFAGNFSPLNWAYCDGQLLSISSNQSLFSILGTTYGGDGRTTFGLPDLGGRSAIGEGQGPGLSSNTLGQKVGVEHVTLSESQLPSHTHGVSTTVHAHNATGTSATPLAITGQVILKKSTLMPMPTMTRWPRTRSRRAFRTPGVDRDMRIGRRNWL